MTAKQFMKTQKSRTYEVHQRPYEDFLRPEQYFCGALLEFSLNSKRKIRYWKTVENLMTLYHNGNLIAIKHLSVMHISRIWYWSIKNKGGFWWGWWATAQGVREILLSNFQIGKFVLSSTYLTVDTYERKLRCGKTKYTWIDTFILLRGTYWLLPDPWNPLRLRPPRVVTASLVR